MISDIDMKYEQLKKIVRLIGALDRAIAVQTDAKVRANLIESYGFLVETFENTASDMTEIYSARFDMCD